MFDLKWAFKNLIANKRRTGGMVGFIALILVIMMVNLLFLDGTSTQMKEALRNSKGDLYLWSKFSLSTADSNLEAYRDKLKNKIRTLAKYSQIYSASGYAEALVLGTEPAYLQYLDRVVSWPQRHREKLKQGSALIENGLAQKLNVKRGDFITIKIKNDSGMVNTLQVKIDGVFVGSNLLFGDVLYINIKDQNLLWINELDFECNDLKLYFKPGITGKDLRIIEEYLQLNYPQAHITCPKLNPTAETAYTTFKYYRYLLIFLFILLNAVFIIILYFAVQNVYFIAFRQRRQELATLLTYGMKHFRIKLIGLWESNLIFALALMLSVPLSLLITSAIHQFEITDSSLGELIAVLGGPRINFSFNWLTIPAMVVLVWAMTLIATYRGVNNYLKLEIREIISRN